MIGKSRKINEINTGLLYKSGDAKDLSKKIEKLITNPKLYNMLKNNSKKYASEFSIEKTVNKINNIFLNVKNNL